MFLFFFFFKVKTAFEIMPSLVGSELCFFFFFKQKTAYEIGVRLVGSEMCIRDRYCQRSRLHRPGQQPDLRHRELLPRAAAFRAL